MELLSIRKHVQSIKWMQMHLLLLDTSTIVPDIEQHSFEECYSSDPKVAINPLTELDILC